MKKLSGIILLVVLFTGLFVSCNGNAVELVFEKKQKISVHNLIIEDIPDQIYTGSAITPELTVKDGSKTLVKDTDYTVAYSNNVNAGTATATITGIGLYAGTLSKDFTINPAQISAATVNPISDQVYTGNAVNPDLSVSFNGRTLVANTDYTVSYSNNTECGTASVQLTGIGNFTGTKDTSFIIKKIAKAYKITGTFGSYNYFANYASSSFNDTNWEESDATTVDALIGNTNIPIYGTGAGYVFYKAEKTVNSATIQYFEASPVDLASSAWGPTGTTEGVEDDFGKGYNNTYNLLNSDSYAAAKACREYTNNEKSDWFLPSVNEMQKMITNVHKKGLGGFTDYTVYWTSSLTGSQNAYSVWSNSCNMSNYPKTDVLKVRACRVF